MTKHTTPFWAVISADLPNDDDGLSPTNYPQYVEPRGDVVVGREVHTPDGHLSLYWEAPRSALVAMAPDPTPAAQAVFVALHGSYAGSVKEHAAQHLVDIAAARAEVAKLGPAVNTWAPRWVPDLDAREAEVLATTATTPLSRAGSTQVTLTINAVGVATINDGLHRVVLDRPYVSALAVMAGAGGPQSRVVEARPVVYIGFTPARRERVEWPPARLVALQDAVRDSDRPPTED